MDQVVQQAGLGHVNPGFKQIRFQESDRIGPRCLRCVYACMH